METPQPDNLPRRYGILGNELLTKHFNSSSPSPSLLSATAHPPPSAHGKSYADGPGATATAYPFHRRSHGPSSSPLCAAITRTSSTISHQPGDSRIRRSWYSQCQDAFRPLFRRHTTITVHENSPAQWDTGRQCNDGTPDRSAAWRGHPVHWTTFDR
jgi:hypothetical protein